MRSLTSGEDEADGQGPHVSEKGRGGEAATPAGPKAWLGRPIAGRRKGGRGCGPRRGERKEFEPVGFFDLKFLSKFPEYKLGHILNEFNFGFQRYMMDGWLIIQGDGQGIIEENL